MQPNLEQPIAVIDLGKTNLKIFVISIEGEILASFTTGSLWVERDGTAVLDQETVEGWVIGQLENAHRDFNISGVMISGHGCTFALLQDNRLALPILDYEQAPPAHLRDTINAAIPEFYHTYSPPLPLGLNFSRHVIWREQEEPEIFRNVDTLLTYPQYWVWLLSGEKASEVSYLGCHTDLWAPLEDDFSSLVKGRDWTKLMPPLRRAGEILGQYNTPHGAINVHNGVHDSNAAFYYYESLGFKDFTLLSTGTWVVIFNTGSKLDELDPKRDMLANVTVDHRIAPTIRYMGGREFDLVSGGAGEQVNIDDLQDVIDAGLMVLPSFAAGGPMPEFKGGFVGGRPAGRRRIAVALVYIALMCDLSLDLIGSQNDIIIDGGLLKSKHFASLLGQLRGNQTIFTSPIAQGSALGAAALAFDATGLPRFPNTTVLVEPLRLAGLDAYKTRWRQIVDTAWQNGAFSPGLKIEPLVGEARV